ncbi:hypothetical protein HNQ57_002069 [Zhongshania antarctica]|jgi:hypothetical protein|uniref:Uncharacterized protein n=1 Tax=Zhongshania antarctica TaxID=641702 RepID=A0A840R5Z6_9GAMM|nr:hypothetical protein [Zhongshania antarctica]
MLKSKTLNTRQGLHLGLISAVPAAPIILTLHLPSPIQRNACYV